MPTFTLDGKDIPFEPGDSIIRAAWRQGIDIPHFCWHPGLSVPANCRMCLVEVKAERPIAMPVLKWDEAKEAYVPDVKPKLVPACQQAAAEGMAVLNTTSPFVQEAQHSNHEFLLLNHPVDCPICDQSGECKLQDYWYEHQGTLKRKITEPVHKPKAERFGETIVYDAERCVMCTRCIRFCDEVVGDHVLDMRERGNKNEIVLSPGRTLDHDYTLMTEHVCPVGSLTSRDFRFKARVWFLRTAPSVCAGCATGCNMHIDFDPRTNKAYRLRPRDNESVNRFWMCDDGMMTYKRFHENRLLVAKLRQGDSMQDVTLAEGLLSAEAQLGSIDSSKIAVVLSAQHPTEDNFVLGAIAEKLLKTQHVYLAALGGWRGDNILRDSDNNPNRAGAQQCTSKAPAPLSQLFEDVAQGLIEGALVLGSQAEEPGASWDVLKGLSVLVNLTAHDEGRFASYATVLFPVATHAEMHGSFVNVKGMTQHFKRALEPPTGIEPAWLTLVNLAARMGLELDYARFQDLNRAVIESRTPDLGITDTRVAP
ncbi:MAG: (2Fe-2S)-binding protein [Myxococcales bacterium]|nr:(2Fe-2S)-binding protein [Myxococcales bacterium]MCB9708764.1 (2Fe-2S)-binding protein [Myxococcales bacterium]